MNKLLLVILIPFFSTVAFSQKRLVVVDNNSGYELKRLDLTKVFSYKIKSSRSWRNGFVTSLSKDTVHLNNGTYPLKNFDYIRQSRKSANFFSTTGDIALYGALSAAGIALTFFIIELTDNENNYYSNHYKLTKGALIVTGGLAVIGGTLKLVTGKKNIPLGGRFSLVIQ